jgi:nicotinamidase/pyrazinamidase
MKLNSKRTGLIIIDMLNDFVRNNGSLVVPIARDLIPNQKNLLETSRDAGLLVIFLTDSHQPDDDEFDKWPPHAVTGTWGSKIIDELVPIDGEMVIAKRRYSGFYGSDLDLTLRERGVDTIIIAGVLTDICVMYTSADASARGYKVVVVSDATGSTVSENHRFALNHMKEVHGAELVTTNDVIKSLSRQKSDNNKGL